MRSRFVDAACQSALPPALSSKYVIVHHTSEVSASILVKTQHQSHPRSLKRASLICVRPTFFRGWKHVALPPQGAAISNLHKMDLHAKFFEYNGASVPPSSGRRHVAGSRDQSTLNDCAASQNILHFRVPPFHHHELSGAVVWPPTRRSHSAPRERERYNI